MVFFIEQQSFAFLPPLFVSIWGRLICFGKEEISETWPQPFILKSSELNLTIFYDRPLLRQWRPGLF